MNSNTAKYARTIVPFYAQSLSDNMQMTQLPELFLLEVKWLNCLLTGTISLLNLFRSKFIHEWMNKEPATYIRATSSKPSPKGMDLL